MKEELRIGVDCASGNEVRQTLAIGFNPEDIIVAHAIKSPNDLEF